MPAQLVFTIAPSQRRRWPRPFVAGGRTVLLCNHPAPRVLILGYGLGAMASVMRRLRPAARITGVELRADLVQRARREPVGGVELHHADALVFLSACRRRFDLIVDDCFALRRGDAVRPAALYRHAELLARRLGPGGITVRNLLPDSEADLGAQTKDLEQTFAHVALRRFRDWDNVFAIASARPLPPNLRRLIG